MGQKFFFSPALVFVVRYECLAHRLMKKYLMHDTKVLYCIYMAATLDSSTLPTPHNDLTLQVFLGSVRSPAFIHNIGCGQE